MPFSQHVIPAKAGIQYLQHSRLHNQLLHFITHGDFVNLCFQTYLIKSRLRLCKVSLAEHDSCTWAIVIKLLLDPRLRGDDV
jgi:hypothetical protein